MTDEPIIPEAGMLLVDEDGDTFGVVAVLSDGRVITADYPRIESAADVAAWIERDGLQVITPDDL